MTTDLLREALHYPDDDLEAPDLASIETRARAIRRRRRSTLLGVGALTVAAVAAGSFAGASVGSLGGAPRTVTRVQPAGGAGGTSAAPTAPTASTISTATPTPAPAAPAVTAAVGERVDMGFGWTVWLRDGQVCRSAPADSGGGTTQPFGCRSITDGNIGGVNLQASGSSDGSMLSGLIPYDAARVTLRTGDTVTDAALVRFAGVEGWTFYYRWLPGPFGSAQVTAYDDRGRVLGRMG